MTREQLAARLRDRQRQLSAAAKERREKRDTKTIKARGEQNGDH